MLGEGLGCQGWQSLAQPGSCLSLTLTSSLLLPFSNSFTHPASIMDCPLWFWGTAMGKPKSPPLAVQLLRLHAPTAGGPGSIPGQGTRSHMPHLKTLPAATTQILHASTKILCARTKTWCGQILKKKKNSLPTCAGPVWETGKTTTFSASRLAFQSSLRQLAHTFPSNGKKRLWDRDASLS